MKTYECSVCNEIKPKSEFEKDKRCKEGIRSRCRKCRCIDRRNNGAYLRERLRKFSIRHNASVLISVEEVEELLRKRTCTYCGVKMDGGTGHPTEATLDHCYHGLNIGLNLIPVCRGCNSSKGKRHIYTFYQSSDKFTYELWASFVRDFTESLIKRKLSDAEVKEMTVNFSEEARDYQ